MFRKSRPDAPSGFFRCEAAGLAWLQEADAVPVVRVLEVGEDHLDLERLTAVPPTPEAAVLFGRGLARLHAAGAPAFGSSPPGWDRDGWFGPLDDPRPMPTGTHDRWGEFLAVRRLRPLADLLEDADLAPPVVGRLRRVADRAAAGAWDDDESPARLHGDLWSGNVLWTPAGATLVDPAAHGGHRESDLAMLALFGLPHLDDVLVAYDDERPLRAGWRRRVALHQLYPVGMHAVLFGGHYGARLDRLLTAVER